MEKIDSSTDLADKIFTVIDVLVHQDWFAEAFPERCSDHANLIVATDKLSLKRYLSAHYPFYNFETASLAFSIEASELISYIEFVYATISKPKNVEYHSFLKHYHLSFDKTEAQRVFANSMNSVFEQCTLPWKLKCNGRVTSSSWGSHSQLFFDVPWSSGDAEVDRMILVAKRDFKQPDATRRQHAIEKLWDAFERLKTISDGPDKKRQADVLLTTRVSTPMKPLIEEEFRTLTDAGNSFRIRHHETRCHQLSSNELEYMFLRMLTLLNFICEQNPARKRMSFELIASIKDGNSDLA